MRSAFSRSSEISSKCQPEAPYSADMMLFLLDLTGVEGRCEAVLFSQGLSFAPPKDLPALAALRRGGGYDLVGGINLPPNLRVGDMVVELEPQAVGRLDVKATT